MGRLREVDKSFEGKTVYIHGVDNAKVRGEKKQLIEAFVKKVNPKTVVLECANGKELTLGRGGHGSCNYNYYFYACVDDFKAEIAAHLIREALEHYCRDNIETSKKLEAAKILGLDINVELVQSN